MSKAHKPPRGWIYAKVGVDFLAHQRMLAIPANRRAEALGVWVAATLYCRWRETDGFCPIGAIREIASDEIVEQLVAVGLLSREVDRVLGHGVRVLKFEVFNETKAQILSRRSGTKKRVTEHRGNKSVTRYIDVTSEGCNAVVPVSVSLSGSSDLEREPEGDSERPSGVQPITSAQSPERYVRLTDKLDPELTAIAQMAGVQDIGAAWAKFTGHYADKFLHVAGKWQLWSTNEAKRERTDRDRARSAQVGSGQAFSDAEALRRQETARKRSEGLHERISKYERDAVPAPVGDLMAAIGGKR